MIFVRTNMNYSKNIVDFVNNAENKLTNQFKEIDKIALYNQSKVLDAFRQEQVALRHFSQTKRKISTKSYPKSKRTHNYYIFYTHLTEESVTLFSKQNKNT